MKGGGAVHRHVPARSPAQRARRRDRALRIGLGRTRVGACAITRTAVTTLILIAISSGLILLFGVVFVARPMRLLRRKAHSIGAGDLELPLVVRQRDEIYDLLKP